MSQFINGKNFNRPSSINRNIQQNNPNQQRILRTSSTVQQNNVSHQNNLPTRSDKKSQESPSAHISALVAHSLTSEQKNSIQYLTALLQVLTAKEFRGLLKQNKSNNLENDAPSHFFGVSNAEDNLLDATDFADFAFSKGICAAGQEEEFIQLLNNMLNEDETNDSNLNELETFHSSAKNLFYELNIQEEPSILKVLAQLLKNMQLNQHIATAEQKRQILALLEEGDEKEEIKGIKFNWAEISEV